MTRQKKTATCPLGGVGVGGKWKTWIWYHLFSGTKRFGQLQRLLPQASRQMLTIQLRDLEQAGVLQRKAYRQALPKVEYSLSDLGQSAEPLFHRMVAWGQWCSEQAGLDYDDWLMRLCDKWKFWIWYHLLSGPKRFGELQRLLPQISRQMLTMQLRMLEQMKVLQREVSAQSPSRVEYKLSELGQKSEPMIRQMYAWGRWYCDQRGLEFDWPVNEEVVLMRQIAATWNQQT
jgi:DNA-binding HxlR family transcriptional regulator